MVMASVSAPPVSHTMGSPAASNDTPGRARERRRGGATRRSESIEGGGVVVALVIGSQLHRASSETDADEFRGRVDDERQEEQGQSGEEQRAEVRAVAHRFRQFHRDIGR